MLTLSFSMAVKRLLYPRDLRFPAGTLSPHQRRTLQTAYTIALASLHVWNRKCTIFNDTQHFAVYVYTLHALSPPSAARYALGTKLHVASFPTDSGQAIWEQLFWLQTTVDLQSLSGWDAARCDEHQFRAKIKVSTWVLEPFSRYRRLTSGVNKEE